MLEDFSFSITNNISPTHFTASSATLLDLFMVTKPAKIITSSQISICGISNHDLIFLSYECNIINLEKPKIYKRYVNSININDDLLLDAEEIPWTQLYSYNNVDVMFNEFYSALKNLLEKHAPFMFVNVKIHGLILSWKRHA